MYILLSTTGGEKEDAGTTTTVDDVEEPGGGSGSGSGGAVAAGGDVFSISGKEDREFNTPRAASKASTAAGISFGGGGEGGSLYSSEEIVNTVQPRMEPHHKLVAGAVGGGVSRVTPQGALVAAAETDKTEFQQDLLGCCNSPLICELPCHPSRFFFNQTQRVEQNSINR